MFKTLKIAAMLALVFVVSLCSPYVGNMVAYGLIDDEPLD